MAEHESPSGTQIETSSQPAKRRESRRITDIKIDIPYGERVNGVDYLTEPSAAEVSNAVASKICESRHYQHDLEALYADFRGRANGNLEAYLRAVREYHAQRIAFFVVNGWSDPIGLNAEGAVRDGGHRYRAARFMGKEEVEVEIDTP